MARNFELFVKQHIRPNKHSRLEEWIHENYNLEYNNLSIIYWEGIGFKTQKMKQRKYTPDFILNDWLIEIKGYNKYDISRWQVIADMINDWTYRNKYRFVVIQSQKQWKEFYERYQQHTTTRAN